MMWLKRRSVARSFFVVPLSPVGFASGYGNSLGSRFYSHRLSLPVLLRGFLVVACFRQPLYRENYKYHANPKGGTKNIY